MKTSLVKIASVLASIICALSAYSQDICLSGNCENGSGKLQCECGYVFEGTFKNGEKVHGKLIKEELVYIGDFKDDMAHGKGEIAFQDGSKYVGDFAFSQPDGLGTYYLANHFIYKGMLAGGYFEGWGSKRNGFTSTLLAGRFVKDELHGIGIIQEPNGTQYIGLFSEGKQVEVCLMVKSGDTNLVHFKKGKVKEVYTQQHLTFNNCEYSWERVNNGIEYRFNCNGQLNAIQQYANETLFIQQADTVRLSEIEALTF